jgi:site-specific recombinase XerD
VRDVLGSKHYSIRTEQSYIDWIARYIRFHQLRHPVDLGLADIEAFLSHLAVDGHIAASTQNQARSALLFLYRHVLEIPIDAPRDVIVAKTPRRLPTVLTKDEVRAVIRELSGTYRLMVQLLYGSGLRLMECVRMASEARSMSKPRSGPGR